MTTVPSLSPTSPSPGTARRGRSLLMRVGAIILVTVVTVGAVAVGVSEQVVERQQHDALLRRAGLVAAMQADALSGPVWEIDARTVHAMIEALRDRDPAIRTVTVHEIGQTEPLAVSGTADASASASASVSIEQPILLRAPNGAAQTVGTLRLVYSTAEETEAAHRAMLPVAGLLLLSLATAIAIISLLLNRVVLRPLQRLTQAAQAVARGDYGARLATVRDDEIGVLTRSFDRMAETVQDYTQTLETRVQQRTEALAETNRRIMDSINYAQLIQSSILPRTGVLDGGLAQHFVLWRPRDVVSGDFYYFRKVESGFLVGVADCTGHGVPGAFMTMTASAMLNNAVDTLGADDPAALLAAVDRKVRAALHQDGTATVWEGGFDNGLDLALCHVVPAEGRLTFAGARIPLLIAGPCGIEEVRADRHSLGYRCAGGGPTFTNHAVELGPDRSFYLFTDGLTDQSGGPRGRSFGKRRLRELLTAGPDRPMDELRSAIETSLADFQGDRPQRDDITLFGFRVRYDDAAMATDDVAARKAA